MITLVFFLACLLSAVSTAPIPGIVFSAVVANAQNTPAQCTISWGTYSDTKIPDEYITIPSGDKVIVNEKIVNMGTWTAAGFIEAIRCANLGLIAPFPKVTKTQRCWQFRVEPNEIISVGAGSCT